MAGQPPFHDWRDPASYGRLRGIDRAGLMWEWLRRDPDYIAWYASASEATRDHAGDHDPLSWGLHFRRKSMPRRARRLSDLAGRARPGHTAHGGTPGQQ